MTVGEIAALAGFSHKLKVASEILGLPKFVTIRDVAMDRCPSEVIQVGVEHGEGRPHGPNPGTLLIVISVACVAIAT